MKTIKVLGTGCSKCVSTERIVKEVISENNFNVTVEKVEDIQEIIEYNVLSTPAIVIDEKVVMSGKTPLKEEIKALLVDNFANNACCSDEA
jgi:small redox-active disulfide protein 2